MKITRWRTSSYSSNGSGNCVEVGQAPGVVAIRDTKNRTAGHLEVPRTAWSAFVKHLNR